jgi:hypothetical protein
LSGHGTSSLELVQVGARGRHGPELLITGIFSGVNWDEVDTRLAWRLG